MTIGAGIAYGTAWICVAASWIAWLWFRAPKHRHKWKEINRDERLRTRAGIKVGERVYCVCEECGEPRSFDIQ